MVEEALAEVEEVFVILLPVRLDAGSRIGVLGFGGGLAEDRRGGSRPDGPGLGSAVGAAGFFALLVLLFLFVTTLLPN